jgi:TM2 domain-containing membrane protein YozV/Tfp pilus assembly protein PilE
MIRQSLDENRLEPHRLIKGLDEKFCESCGEIIKSRARICPKCGIHLRNRVSKPALMLLSFFLGGIGIHKFYLGNITQGIIYALFSWTGIPAVIGLIEFVIYAFTSSERLQEKYRRRLPTLGEAVGLSVILIFIGLIGSLAIQQFANFRTNSYNAAAWADLRNAAEAQEAYFLEHKRYADSIEALIGVDGLCVSRDVRVDVQSLDDKSYMIVAHHESGNKIYMVIGPNGRIQASPK